MVPSYFDLLERTEDLVPREAALAGGTAVVLSEVEVSELPLAGEDRAAERVLLDVHVEGVELDFAGRAADRIAEGQSLLGGVDEELLEPVDHLERVDDPIPLGHLGDLLDALDRPIEVGPLVREAGRRRCRPGAEVEAREDGSVEEVAVVEQALHVFGARLPHRGVGRGEILAGAEADAGRHREAEAVGGRLELLLLRLRQLV